MNNIQWPLEVLSRSIQYKNLTGASQHIGLSQPQISRLISKLEKELNLTLLDRRSKRTSTWTPEARRLADIYWESNRKLQHQISEMLVESEPKTLHLGTLEGLSSLAMRLAKTIFDKTSIQSIQLDVFDQDQLESLFLNTDIDLIFSSRVPGRKKLKHLKEVGGQGFQVLDTNREYKVFSSFEFNQKKYNSPKRLKAVEKILVSNSLYIRHDWFEKFGGRGQLPGIVEKRKKVHDTPVLILGQDFLNSIVWRQVEEFSV